MENGDGKHREPPPPAASQLFFANSLTHYVALPDGGMELVLTPALPTQGGMVMSAPQVRVYFSAVGWERFKAQVAADGLVSPIVIAHGMPPG